MMNDEIYELIERYKVLSDFKLQFLVQTSAVPLRFIEDEMIKIEETILNYNTDYIKKLRSELRN